jgi:hypothetical protein
MGISTKPEVELKIGSLECALSDGAEVADYVLARLQNVLARFSGAANTLNQDSS